MTETTEIAIIPANPAALLKAPGSAASFIDDLRAKLLAERPDTSTATNRKRIASLAFQVRRSKTAMAEAAATLTEEARALIEAVNEEKKAATALFDDLATEIRAPLTAWEEAEAAREQRYEAFRTTAINYTTISATDTIEQVEERRADLSAMRAELVEFETHRQVVLREMFDAADAAMQAAIVRLKQQAEEQAELARLRAEAAARAERDRIEREKREAAEAAERARLAEEQRQREAQEAAERARAEEAARIQREREEAAEAERRAAEERAAAERERQEAEHRAEVERVQAEERARREQAEAEAAELRRQAAERAAAEKAERDAAEARERDRRHRGAVMKSAKEAIMTAGGVDETAAKAIVLAIGAGKIPHVGISF